MQRPADARRRRRGARLASFLSAVVVLAACSPSQTPPSPSPSAPASAGADTGPIGSPVPTGGTASAAPQATVASSTLIDDAEQAGTIDHATALAYQLFASLDYASLPAAYQSSNPAEPEATTILAELADRLDQLAPDLRAKVAPFYLRPTDPASFWQRRLTRTASVGIRLAAFTAATEMDYVDADSAPIRVWYATPLGTSERALAVQLADEIDASHMWDKEKAAMLGHEPCADSNLAQNGGSGRLDIYIVYPVTGLDWGGRSSTVTRIDPDTHKATVANGLTTLDGPGDNACNGASHVIVNGSLDFEHLKSTTAHELFHAFQFSFRHSQLPDHNWWSEASATWAKDLVYPRQNFEQDYLSPWWSAAPGQEGPLDNTGSAAYGAYLWAFYLDQKSGDPTGSAIGALWQASQTVAPIQAMAALPGWIDRFKEFALWNWNKDTVVHYQDADQPIPTEKLSQKPTCMDGHVAGGGACYLEPGKITLTLDMARTSVQYFEGIPDAPLIELLKFDLTDVQYQHGLGIQAILKYKSGVKVEDWTGLGSAKFCVNRDELEQVDLVVSNSNAAAGAGNIKGSVTVEGLATGCSTGHYSIDVANVGGGHHEGPGHHEGDGTVECAVNGSEWTVGGVYSPNDPDAPGRDIGSFHITTTPGHEWVEMTVMHPTTDSPFSWSVMPAFGGTFSFTTNNAVRPWTIKAVADDPTEHVTISATCSVMEGG
jgi:hypothetical protein